MGMCLLVAAFPSLANAANIDEIAYLSNKSLKELSSKAMAMITNPSLGICGRRRELKVTGRNTEGWLDLIQAALRRDQPSKRTFRINVVGKSGASVDSAVNRMLSASGYHPETPADTDESVKTFKSNLKSRHAGFSIFSGQVRGVEASGAFSFLALVDEIHNELLILSLGEELCR